MEQVTRHPVAHRPQLPPAPVYRELYALLLRAAGKAPASLRVRRAGDLRVGSRARRRSNLFRLIIRKALPVSGGLPEPDKKSSNLLFFLPQAFFRPVVFGRVPAAATASTASGPCAPRRPRGYRFPFPVLAILSSPRTLLCLAAMNTNVAVHAAALLLGPRRVYRGRGQRRTLLVDGVPATARHVPQKHLLRRQAVRGVGVVDARGFAAQLARRERRRGVRVGGRAQSQPDIPRAQRAVGDGPGGGTARAMRWLSTVLLGVGGMSLPAGYRTSRAFRSLLSTARATFLPLRVVAA